MISDGAVLRTHLATAPVTTRRHPLDVITQTEKESS